MVKIVSCVCVGELHLALTRAIRSRYCTMGRSGNREASIKFWLRDVKLYRQGVGIWDQRVTQEPRRLVGAEGELVAELQGQIPSSVSP